MKLALNSGIQTYQTLTNDDEVCIPSLSSILLAVTDDIADQNPIMYLYIFRFDIQIRVTKFYA